MQLKIVGLHLFSLTLIVISQNCVDDVFLGDINVNMYQMPGRNVRLRVQRADLILPDSNRLVQWFKNSTYLNTREQYDLNLTILQPNVTVIYHYKVYDIIDGTAIDLYESKKATLRVGINASAETNLANNFNYTEGSNAKKSIFFNVQGNPEPSLSVIGPTTSKTNFIRGTGYSFYVRGLTLSDRGTYFFTAANCFGTAKIEIQVDILSGIVVQSSSQEGSLICGTRAKFVCTAIGFPKSSISWSWGREKLLPHKHPFDIEVDTAKHTDSYKIKVESTLRILDVQRADNSKEDVICHASNGIESKTANFSFHVKCTPTPCLMTIIPSQTTNTSVSVQVAAPNDAGGELVSNYRVLAYNKEVLLFNQTLKEPSLVKVTNLSSRSTIKLSCSAENRIGYGESSELEVQTKGEPLLIRTELESVGCSSVTMRFALENETSTLISRYEVLYKEILHSFVGSPAPSLERTKNFSCPVATLADLERNANYSVSVRAMNKYGKGEYSSPKYFQTVCLTDAGLSDEILLTVIYTLVGIALICLLVILVLFGFTLWQENMSDLGKARKKILKTFSVKRQRVLILGPSGNGKKYLVSTFNYVVNLIADSGANYINPAGDETEEFSATLKQNEKEVEESGIFLKHGKSLYKRLEFKDNCYNNYRKHLEKAPYFWIPRGFGWKIYDLFVDWLLLQPDHRNQTNFEIKTKELPPTVVVVTVDKKTTENGRLSKHINKDTLTKLKDKFPCFVVATDPYSVDCDKTKKGSEQQGASTRDGKTIKGEIKEAWDFDEDRILIVPICNNYNEKKFKKSKCYQIDVLEEFAKILNPSWCGSSKTTKKDKPATDRRNPGSQESTV
eukprot:m.30888 g.30888  ORF g.30888 m.30888 type:complete len:845 (+) comp31411_c0_seq4:101-2635(+)